MTHRFLIGFLAAAALFVVPADLSSSGACAAEDAGQFIMRLADRALGALTNPELKNTVRAERFRTLLREGLDIPFIASRALGPYIRRATDADLKDLETLLEENIVRKYAIMFKGYSSKRIELVETKTGRRGTKLVTINVHPTDDSAPVSVRWVVHEVNGTNKIIDIIVEGVSMVTTQREEFVSVIRRGGGKIGALLDDLRARNAELADNTFD